MHMSFWGPCAADMPFCYAVAAPLSSASKASLRGLCYVGCYQVFSLVSHRVCWRCVPLSFHDLPWAPNSPNEVIFIYFRPLGPKAGIIYIFEALGLEMK